MRPLAGDPLQPFLRRAALALAGLVFVSPAVDFANALTADSVADVCAADADPCVITEPVQLAPGTTLDFGLRAVQVTGQGALEFPEGSSTLRCGSLSADTAGPAIRFVGSPERGSARIEARRRCELGPSELTCTNRLGCLIGPCDHRCEQFPARTCSDDSGCQVGPCVPTFGGARQVCSQYTFQTCTSNSDCELGPCSSQTLCANHENVSVACATHDDCDRGACSLGDGSIHLDAPVSGEGEAGAEMWMRAAGSVEINGHVTMSSNRGENDGGSLRIDTGDGDIVIRGPFFSRGGPLGYGGTLDAFSGADAYLLAPVQVSGLDGGDLDIRADRDVFVSSDVRASAVSGWGLGGYINLEAERDLVVAPGADGKTLRLIVRGNSGGNSLGGDGGNFYLYSGRDLTVEAGVRFVANGTRPDGGGGELNLEADGNLHFDADMVAASRSVDAETIGSVYAEAGGSVVFGENSRIRMAGGGLLWIAAEEDIDFAAEVDLRVSNFWGTSGAEITSDNGDVNFEGRIRIQGHPSHDVEIEACRIRFAPGAWFESLSDGGETYLTARESMILAEGSTLLAKKGLNRLFYRTAEKPPVLDGTIETSPELTLRPLLPGCPVCGNFEIDAGETCDDGNISPGDGCSEICLVE
jgi:cysteine-rich repeat protein